MSLGCLARAAQHKSPTVHIISSRRALSSKRVRGIIRDLSRRATHTSRTMTILLAERFSRLVAHKTLENNSHHSRIEDHLSDDVLADDQEAGKHGGVACSSFPRCQGFAPPFFRTADADSPTSQAAKKTKRGKSTVCVCES